ncbi:MAG TPA: lipoprotein insertase outer membrane protein LolB [Steroidobacteraceae bacterium]|nr:lipoprotein insertase outer membrane protein LolB [Steroidobacteraceae bacterium]
MQNSRAWGAAAAALLALAGCRTLPPPAPAAPPWDTRRPELQAREHFELKGRVAVAAGSQGFNARLRWAQDGGRAQVALEGPLGAGAVHIDTHGSDLDITTASGARLTSAAARAELSARLGFDPPLASLRYWILGVPDPASPADETLDPARQHLTRLEQQGWRIDYGSYVAVGSEWLPGRLTLERADVRVKLLVDDWHS